MEDLQLTFGQLEQVLKRLHGVETEKRRFTLRSRLQHLQRNDFPQGVAGGRGRKYAYTTDRFFQVVFALEFAVARVPPIHATRIVSAGWPALSRFVDAARSRHAAGVRVGEEASDHWCLVVPRGLDMLRSDDDTDAVEQVQEVPADVVAGWMLGASAAPSATMILIDMQTIALRALEALDAVRAAAAAEMKGG